MKREEYISDEMVVKRVNAAVRIELEKRKAMDVPTIIIENEGLPRATTPFPCQTVISI